MKRLSIFLLLIGILYAGAGDYLGFDYLKYWAYDAFKVDSSINGVQTETSSDTTIIVDTFTYLGYPAYSVERRSDGEIVATDTLWEVNDSMFGRISINLDTTFASLLYVTPFNLGNSWNMGLPPYIAVDFDDPPDGIIDTAYITYDSVKVVGVESVQVPYGQFNNVFKIERVFHFDLWISSSNQGGPYTGTGYDTLYEWIEPYFGLVKDSSRFETTVWVIVFPVTTATTSWRLLRGTGYATGVEESREFLKEQAPRLIVEKSGVRILNIPDGILKLYNVSGQALIETPYREGTLLRLNLPNGIYIATIKSDKKLYNLKFLWIR